MLLQYYALHFISLLIKRNSPDIFGNFSNTEKENVYIYLYIDTIKQIEKKI